MNINKNISIWRGDSTPPTNYHFWIKSNGQQFTFNGEKWVNYVEDIPTASLESKGLMSSQDKVNLEECVQHLEDTSNPHHVSKEQIGLGNVTNDAQVKRSELGVTVATLNDNGKVTESQLPSYVDDILEGKLVSVTEFTLNAGQHGEVKQSGVIYLDTTTNTSYRWSGSQYVMTGSSLTLGEGEDQAFPGNRGVNLENQSVVTSLLSEASEDKVTIKVTQKSLDGKSESTDNVDIQTATTTKAGVMSAADKAALDELPISISEAEIGSISNTQTANDVTIETLSANQRLTTTIPCATSTTAGVMSAEDKVEVNKIKDKADKVELKAVSDKVDTIIVPTKVSELTNDLAFQTKTEVNTAIQKVVGAAPEALDTLEEIATKLSDNDDAVAGIVNTLSDKANVGDSYTKTESDAKYLTTGAASDTYLPKATYTASDILTKIKTVDGAGSGLDADTLDGAHGKDYMYRNAYNFSNGCLVRLKLLTSGRDMMTVHIKGNSYRAQRPIDTWVQFYNYAGNYISSPAAIHNGYDFGDINVFYYDGHVYLWFKQTGVYQSFSVYAECTNNPRIGNLVEDITNAAMPESGVSGLVTIVPKKSALTTDLSNVLKEDVVDGPLLEEIENLTKEELKAELLGDVDSKLVTKVDKVEGKGLSTNDYTNAEKSKLSALPTATELDAALDVKLDKSVWDAEHEQFGLIGYYHRHTSGEFYSPSTGYRNSGFIPINKNNDIIFKVWAGGAAASIVFFASDCKTRVYSVAAEMGVETTIAKEDIPKNAVFFVVNCPVGYVNNKSAYYSNGPTRESREGAVSEAILASKSAVFDDLWIKAAGSNGTVDHTHTEDGVNKPYYLNEVWMTYEEALLVYNEYFADIKSLYGRVVYGVTNFAPPDNNASVIFSNFSAPNAVTINVGVNFRASGFMGWCPNSPSLTKIIGRINLQFWQGGGNSYGYLGAPNLRDINLYHLSKDFNISSLKIISLSSMQYMVNNSTATSTITVTVHPYVYAKLTGDTTNINPSTKITREVTVEDQIWTGDVELVFDLYCENLIFEPFDTIIIPDIINPGTNEPIRGTVDRVIDTTHKITRVIIEKPAFDEEGEVMFNTIPIGSKIMRVDRETTEEELTQWQALVTTANSKNISFATTE